MSALVNPMKFAKLLFLLMGLAFALLLRGRELIWIVIGLALASGYSLRLKDVPVDGLESDG